MADEKGKDINEQRAELRRKNLVPIRATESALALRDSSLKKNTAFVRKIKTYNETQQAAIFADIKGLNLSKYISEICQAIVESKFKLSDVLSLVQVCSRLHADYADFSPNLVEHMQKSISSQAGNPAKARVDLRFCAELLLTGIPPLREGFQLVKQFLQEMCSQGQQSLSAVISLCKGCGDELLALNPASETEHYVPLEKQKMLQLMVREYFKSICRYAVREHDELSILQKKHRSAKQSKGVAPSEMSEKLEAAQVTFAKLMASLEQLAALLGETAPQFNEPEEPSEGEGVVQGVVIETELSEEPLWEDAETQVFYEHLPDLKAIMPAILKDMPKDEKEQTSTDEENDNHASIVTGTSSSEPEPDEDVQEKVEEEMHKVEMKPQLELFLRQLPQCLNKDTIDQMAEQFCFTLNTRPNRYKLTRTLFLVPRTRLDLLPLYSRLVAILKPVATDIGEELCNLLLRDFSYQLRKKDQMNIETKVKTVRFLAELTKFQVLPQLEALCCLKRLLADFSHHTIDMSCHFIECCGRYLFLQPESHGPLRALVEQMLRKKTVANLDPRHLLMVENACAVVISIATPRPPPRVTQRSPLERFLRKLLYQDLTKQNVDKVVRQLRKLDWSSDSEQLHLAIRLLSAPHEIRYFNIRFLANTVAVLATFQDCVGPRVVDATLEEIRLGMEVNDPKFNQRRVAAVHYLGELYNYRLTESALIFAVLYSLITFGAGTPLDPPENVFRLKLVCCLLDTCAGYFDHGSSKKRLDAFLHFVLLYFWRKKEDFGEGFPVTVELCLKETIQPLRPKYQWPKNLEAAQAAVEKLFAQAFAASTEDRAKAHDSEHFHKTGDSCIADESPASTAETDEKTQPDILENASDGEPDVDEEYDEDDDFEDEDDEIEEDETESEEFKDELEEPEPEPDEFQLAFEAEFEEMVSESITQRSQDKSQLPQVKEIAVPQLGTLSNGNPTNLVISQASKAGNSNLISSGSNQAISNGLGNLISFGTSTSMSTPIVDLIDQSNFEKDQQKLNRGKTNFVIMMRSQNRNKPQLRQIELDDNDELAQKIAQTQKREREEKQRMKQLTLNMNMRQEEESWNDDAPDGHLIGPERKFQHPRGAPDADLIFGSSSRRR